MAENAFKADWPSFALGFNTGKSKGGGGAELNIAYGDTAPEDTTKLWVKTAEPNGVLISTEVEETEVDGESFYKLRTKLPYPLCLAGCAVVGSKIYIIGGVKNDGTGNTSSDSVLIYDTEKGTLEELKGVLGTGIVNIICAVVGTRIYFVGGGASYSTTSNLIRYFDTEKNELVTCTTQMDVAMYSVACVAKDKTLYIFSGSNRKAVYAFDTENEALTTISDNFRTSWVGSRWCRIGSKIYYFASGGNAFPRQVFTFDIDSLAVTAQDSGYSIPIIASCSYGVLNGYIYMIGGNYLYKIYRYKNTGSATTSYVEMPFTANSGSYYSACATVGNKIYCFGGSTLAAYTDYNPVDEVNVYSLATPAPSIPSGSLYVKPSTEDNIFPVVNSDGMSVEIGVDTVYKGNAEGIGEPVEAALYNGNEWQTI